MTTILAGKVALVKGVFTATQAAVRYMGEG